MLTSDLPEGCPWVSHMVGCFNWMSKPKTLPLGAKERTRENRFNERMTIFNPNYALP